MYIGFYLAGVGYSVCTWRRAIRAFIIVEAGYFVHHSRAHFRSSPACPQLACRPVSSITPWSAPRGMKSKFKQCLLGEETVVQEKVSEGGLGAWVSGIVCIWTSSVRSHGWLRLGGWRGLGHGGLADAGRCAWQCVHGIVSTWSAVDQPPSAGTRCTPLPVAPLSSTRPGFGEKLRHWAWLCPGERLQVEQRGSHGGSHHWRGLRGTGAASLSPFKCEHITPSLLRSILFFQIHLSLPTISAPPPLPPSCLLLIKCIILSLGSCSFAEMVRWDHAPASKCHHPHIFAPLPAHPFPVGLKLLPSCSLHFCHAEVHTWPRVHAH